MSLFSGAGGMDVGFEGGFSCLRKSVNGSMHPDWVAGPAPDGAPYRLTLARTRFDTVFSDDIREDARAAWTSYFAAHGKPDAESAYHVESVVSLVKRARAGERVFPSGIDVVTGGFPCNDFSVSGKRRGFDSKVSHTGRALDVDEPTAESRGQLYMWMRDVITLVEPRIFVAENVKGLTNLGDAKQVIEHDFADAGGGGYVVVPARVLYAPDYGVPQSRERVFFFGFRRDALLPEALAALTSDAIPPEYDPYPAPTHGDGEGLVPYVTSADAFEGLVEPEESGDLSQRAYSRCKYLGKRCQGQNEVRLDGVAPTIRAEHHGNIEYRRLSAEHGGTHAGELAAGLPERRLTVRECARIQTFPDDYEFVRPARDGERAISASSAYTIIGNAVPCVLAYNIARSLEEKWGLWFGED